MYPLGSHCPTGYNEMRPSIWNICNTKSPTNVRRCVTSQG